MATRTIAFRLNDKNREDKEIMDWLDKAVYEGEYYDSLTEAVKWAILCFARGEIRFREEEAGLGKSEVPLDASTKASLAAMFGDDD